MGGVRLPALTAGSLGRFRSPAGPASGGPAHCCPLESTGGLSKRSVKPPAYSPSVSVSAASDIWCSILPCRTITDRRASCCSPSKRAGTYPRYVQISTERRAPPSPQLARPAAAQFIPSHPLAVFFFLPTTKIPVRHDPSCHPQITDVRVVEKGGLGRGATGRWDGMGWMGWDGVLGNQTE